MRRRAWVGWGLAAVAGCAIQATGPIALDDAVATSVDQSVEVAVLLNDRAPTGSRLSVDVISSPAGSLEPIGDGVYLYQPPPGFEGFDSFEYSASAGGQSATATVTVTIGTPDSTTTTTTIDTTSTTGPATTIAADLLVDPDLIDFGEAFVGVPTSREVTLSAIGTAIDLAPVSAGDVSFDPGECQVMEVDDECTASIAWTPSTIGGIRPGSIDLSGQAAVTVTGSAVHALMADPASVSTQFEAPAREAVVEFLIRNVADGPVRIGLIDAEDLGTVTVDTEAPTGQPCIDAHLEAGDECRVLVIVDQSGVAPGEVTAGSIRVLYAATELGVPVSLVALPPSPDLTSPQAGQSIWWDLLRRGITMVWRPVEGVSSYRAEAEVCFGESCQVITSTVTESIQTTVALGQNTDQMEALWTEAGNQAILRLRITALAGPDNIESQSDWVPFELVAEAFDVRAFDPDPPEGSNLCVSQVTVETDMVSHLLENSEVVLEPYWQGQPTGQQDSQVLATRPQPQTLTFQFAAPGDIDQFIWRLADGTYAFTQDVSYVDCVVD